MKKCPLIKTGCFANSQPELIWNNSADNCIENMCAWWNSKTKRCAVMDISRNLATVKP